MHEAVRTMLDKYNCRTSDEYTHALREILQEVALLGLWRSRFFEHAAFYGGTALRVLYGMNRFSEDMDFSLIEPDDSFSLGSFGNSLTREIESFGFNVSFEEKERRSSGAIDSAFLKANTFRELMVIEASDEVLRTVHQHKRLKIKIEVDVDPPGGFETESKYLLHPIPFSVRVYSLPDLFAGKLHAVLCRKWKRRVKGRDWYDLVWYAANHPYVRLSHLESRMRQSGDYEAGEPLSLQGLENMLNNAITELDVDNALTEVAPFVRDRRDLDIWSHDFFRDLISRISTEE